MPEDLEFMRQLLDVYAEAFYDHVSYQSKPPGDSYLTSLLKKDSFITIVALSKDRVVGGLSAYVLEKFEQERSEVYIYDLAVLEKFRRQGIATELIIQLKLIVKSLGAWVIFVQADKVDEPAIKLYESLGTREEVLHFDIEV